MLLSLGWIECAAYATIPAFWLMIHPWAGWWRERGRSPYWILLPVWVGMWIVVAGLTWHWRTVAFYGSGWSWIPGGLLFAVGILIYMKARAQFNWAQLGGLPEILPRNRDQRLVTTGIRARVRHPVYLGHLCVMLAWSVGTGLAVCWALTAFAMMTGAAMIHMEDAELEQRFGDEFRRYRSDVSAIVPRL